MFCSSSSCSSSSSNCRESGVSGGDNRQYNDTNTAQKLSIDDKSKLKESGASGVQIIQSLMSNSETFSGKTEFAQEKWLKRKQKKYVKRM